MNIIYYSTIYVHFECGTAFCFSYWSAGKKEHIEWSRFISGCPENMQMQLFNYAICSMISSLFDSVRLKLKSEDK